MVHASRRPEFPKEGTRTSRLKSYHLEGTAPSRPLTRPSDCSPRLSSTSKTIHSLLNCIAQRLTTVLCCVGRNMHLRFPRGLGNCCCVVRRVMRRSNVCFRYCLRRMRIDRLGRPCQRLRQLMLSEAGSRSMHSPSVQRRLSTIVSQLTGKHVDPS